MLGSMSHYFREYEIQRDTPSLARANTPQKNMTMFPNSTNQSPLTEWVWGVIITACVRFPLFFPLLS